MIKIDIGFFDTMHSLVYGSNTGLTLSTYTPSRNTNRMLRFGGYVNTREFLYSRAINRVNTILNHNDTRMFLPRYHDSCMLYIPNWY